MHGTRVGLAVVLGMMMAMSAMGANASQPMERGIRYEDAARASFPELLEFYGEDFDPETGLGRIEIWLPLADQMTKS